MEPIAETLSHAAAWTVRNSLAASLFAGFVLLITRWLGGRLHPRLIALLWVIVGIRLVLPVAPSSSYSLFHLFPAAPVTEAVAPAAPALPFPVAEAPLLAPIPESGWPGSEAALPSAEVPLNWPAALALVWALVAIGLILRTLIRQRVLAREIRRLPAVVDGELRQLLAECSRLSGIRGRFRFVTAPAGGGVAVFGFLHVTHLIVPADFSDRYSRAERRGILLHELAHIRRHDLLWNWAALGIQCFHWFNPLVWIAARRFLAAREALCDRDAVSLLNGEERRTYGGALVKALEMGRLHPAPGPHPAMSPFFSKSSELKTRLTMILKPQSTPLPIQLTALALAAAAGLATFTTASVADEEGRSRESESKSDTPREREGSERSERSREGEREKGESRRGEGERTTRESARDGEEKPRRGGDEAATPTSREGQLKIAILRDGVSINGKTVSLVNLRRELDGSTAKSAVLMADRGVPFQTVETVVTALKGSGVEEISFGGAGEGSANTRDGDGAPKTGPRDGEGAPRTGLRDGEGAPKSGPRDGDGAPRTGPREGEGAPKTGPRDGETPRSGPRDGEMKREGSAESEGAPKSGPRDGEGAPRSAPREGDAERKTGPRDGESAAPDDRQVQQATRIYRAYDKDGDDAVTFEEWLAMKNGEMTADRKATEKGWFDQADASSDGRVTLAEWITWQANRGRDRG